MKCSNPMCNRAVGLVSHRRWFDNGRYCSRRCRDNYAAPPRSKLAAPLSDDARLFAWLFAPPGAHASSPLARATVRVRARKT
jgi:hypothetical protein